MDIIKEIINNEYLHDSYIERLEIIRNQYLLSDIVVIILLPHNKWMKLSFINTYSFSFKVEENYSFALVYEVRIKQIDNDYYLSFQPTSNDPNGDISKDENYIYCQDLILEYL